MPNKTNLLTLIFAFATYFAIAQPIEYKRIAPMYPYKIANIDGVSGQASGQLDVDIFDANGDGYLDVMHAGKGHTHLHINNGGGFFLQKLSTDFVAFEDVDENFVNGTTHADIDNDGDEDILLYVSSTMVLYTNDGLGNFSKKVLENVNSVEYGATKMADVNGDGYVDLFVAGKVQGGNNSAILYLNDGNGGFTMDSQNQFKAYTASCKSSIIDIDGDQDLDIIISGYTFINSTVNLETSVYINDGNGGFSLKTDHNLPNINPSEMLFIDIDNDMDMDVILSGTIENTPNPKTYFYKNNGNGEFEPFESPLLNKLSCSSIAASDIDDDGDLDLAIITTNYGLNMYKNDGQGNFSSHHIHNDFFQYVTEGVLTFIDIDNNNSQDLLVIGNSGTGMMYENDGAGYFKPIIGGLPALPEGELIFADIDQDGDQDGFMIGTTNNVDTTLGMFINNGHGIFHRRGTTELFAFNQGTGKFEDFNNDGYPDIIISGYNYQDESYVALNDGTGHFPKPHQIIYRYGHISIADINNDGYKDIFIGDCSTSNPTVDIRMNDGTGHFSGFTSPFGEYCERAKDFADIDNDGDQDIIVCITDGWNSVKKFLNDGSGNFAEATSDEFIDAWGNAVQADRVNFADYDLDGDQDVLLGGGTQTGINLYLNDGNGQFVRDANAIFDDCFDVNVEDIDRDGDQDILLLNPIAFYMNDGAGQFTKFTPPFQSLISGNVGKSTFADIDNDGDLDLFLYGQGLNVTHVYRNIKFLLLADNDQDGVQNELEDTNLDGNVENDDTDNDGIPDYLDSDDDGDLVSTVTEAVVDISSPTNYLDTDQNGTSNYLDDDDDGDGTLTKDEDYDGDGNPLNDDTNNNGIPDYLDNTVTSNKELQPQLPFYIAPNPSNGQITINLNKEYSDLKIKIYSALGQIIYRSKSEHRTSQIDIDGSLWENGIYYILIEGKSRSSAKKLIIRH